LRALRALLALNSMTASIQRTHRRPAIAFIKRLTDPVDR